MTSDVWALCYQKMPADDDCRDTRGSGTLTSRSLVGTNPPASAVDSLISSAPWFWEEMLAWESRARSLGTRCTIASRNTPMRIPAAAGILFALIFCSPPTVSDPVSIRLAECEASLCGGLWTLDGTAGKARWPNDVVAELSVERFDQNKVLRRKDTAGPFVGLTAVYTGVLRDLFLVRPLERTENLQVGRCSRSGPRAHRIKRYQRGGTSARPASRSQWSLALH